MENIFELSFVGQASGLMKYIRSQMPLCSICKDSGVVTRTEWSDEDGRDMDYEIETKCICQED